MLKCIHKTPVFNTGLRKLVTDFHRHYLIFEENKAYLYDIDGNLLSQFECRGGMQEGVFADNLAIVATDADTLNFYDIKNRTNKIIKCKKPIHALLPGPEFDSYCVATYKGTGIELELISSREENVVFRLSGVSSILSGLKRFFTGVAKPVEVSMSYVKTQTYVCNKIPEVAVFSGKSVETLGKFPLPIYRAVLTPFGTMYFVGVEDKTVCAFDETAREMFTADLPFAIKDVLSTDNGIVLICEYGAIFLLNFRGDIVDGGFIAKEIISCQASPDGLLWCLTEDNSVMIIAQEETDEIAKMSQWLHLDTAGRKTPLQESFSILTEKDKERKSKDSGLEAKARKLNKKEKELKNLELKLKKEYAKLPLLLNEIKKREKKAGDKLNSAEKLEAEMLRLGTAEELCKKLKELKKKADEDKVEFPVTEEEINKAEQEIKETEKLSSGLNERLKSKKEELQGMKNKASSLSQEELKLNEDINQVKKDLAKLASGIEKNKVFLKSTPQQIKALEDEEKACNSKVKELSDHLAVAKKKTEDATLTKEKFTEELKSKADELSLILESTKVVREKAKNIPEINELAQKLAKLVEETQTEESNV